MRSPTSIPPLRQSRQRGIDVGSAAVTAATLILLSAYVSVGANAQSVPTLPGDWSYVGCYTDISTSRTLTAASISGDNMTIELCLGFCGGQNYIYAGTEFANCDSTIQYPSVPAPLDNCNWGCSGDSSEICGASGKISIFDSGDPPPVFVQNVSASGGVWDYQGCFTDSTSARTLAVPVNIPGGVTPESCTAACQALGSYSYAGLEIGRECWCDDTVSPPTQRVADADCRMVCDANHEEYCGNTNRVAIYQFEPAGSGDGDSPECNESGSSSFSLAARNRNDGTTTPLKVIVVEMVKSLTWTLLSACPNCCSEWPTFALSNSILQPQSVVDPTISMTNIAPIDGESLTFVASSPPFPGSQSYCTQTDPSVAPSGPQLLSYGGVSNAFSLCHNDTANGRLDVVFAPVTGHPHYVLADCSPVDIQVVVGS